MGTGSSASVDVRSNLTRAEFDAHYLRARQPVILTDAISEWPALVKWTPQYLKDIIGDRHVPFRGLAEDQCGFFELTERVLGSSPECPGTYMQNVDIGTDLSELYQDVMPRITYASPCWKSSRLLAKDWLQTNDMEAFFYGGPGTQLQGLHYDYYGVDAFISQIFGEKEFLVFAPDDTRFLYPKADNSLVSMIEDPLNADLQRFPAYVEARPIRFMLYPGQTLYIPNGWWHTTRMHTVSMTVITTYWNRANWHLLVREIFRIARNQRLLRDLCMVPYLAFVGASKSLGEWLSRSAQSNR